MPPAFDWWNRGRSAGDRLVAETEHGSCSGGRGSVCAWRPGHAREPAWRGREQPAGGVAQCVTADVAWIEDHELVQDLDKTGKVAIALQPRAAALEVVGGRRAEREVVRGRRAVREVAAALRAMSVEEAPDLPPHVRRAPRQPSDPRRRPGAGNTAVVSPAGAHPVGAP